ELHVVFGSGPVGLAVIEALLAQGKQVRVASRSGARRGLPESIEVVRGDATIPDAHAGCARVRATSTAASTRRSTTAGRSSFRRSSAASWPGQPRLTPS